MKLLSTSFDNVYLIEEPVFEDDRGYFMETWNEMEYSNKSKLSSIPSLMAIQNDNSLFSTLFVQDNISVSKKESLEVYIINQVIFHNQNLLEF